MWRKRRIKQMSEAWSEKNDNDYVVMKKGTLDSRLLSKRKRS
jgi:hypothetical protein